MIHTYTDAYLAPLVTQDREDRAITDVADLGTLPATWVTRLQICRAYIITCMECQQRPDDLFAAKLASYRKEWPDTLASARFAQAQIDAAGGSGSSGSSSSAGSMFSIELFRA